MVFGKKLIIVLAAVFVASPVLADSLVMFKNGKAMRVKTVTKQKDWLKCEFEDKNFISVPASSIARIEEADLGGKACELRATPVETGTGGGYVPPPRDQSVQNDPPPAEEEQVQPSPQDEDFLRQQGVGVNGVNRPAGGRQPGRGVPIPQGVNPGVQQG